MVNYRMARISSSRLGFCWPWSRATSPQVKDRHQVGRRLSMRKSQVCHAAWTGHHMQSHVIILIVSHEKLSIAQRQRRS
ncbi:hypothetical protein TRIATDRAFT_259432 [Trichoderma atroviride IMI 206040]|uniref:Uncharacterized protein n=1 Tax=Hypocrea atroviridis (strain ATCC 20476 / IMI 206040) TaxID=452589 RepID=G9P7P7_HYPAI|nr:uncharacterized protein TRIATDRAFT_259432 [Trichoderma atroviride IMI 206040]EHK41639.1 hypothetical protein TRIATDRAFT_259432 [Trichoderma atroviride IMI 206040]